MKFNTIELNNIGPYAGKNKFDFTGDSARRVILIGGKNGAGKTTLLNSIKIGLFGSFSYGYKSDNKEYFNRIIQILNNKAKESRIIKPFSISVSITMNEEYEIKDYKLTRSWKYREGKIQEFLIVEESGRILGDDETHRFQSQLKESLPPQLLDFCLFDGEEIANIVNNNELSTHLSALSKVVFKLNLFEKLEEDLDLYSQQALSTNDKNQSELQNYIDRQKNLRQEQASLTKLLEEAQLNKEKLQEELSQHKSDFDQNGGLVKAERERLIREINNLEIERKKISEEIKSYTSNMLPLHLSFKFLNDARKQIRDEEAIHFVNKLDNLLGEQELEAVISQLQLNPSIENKKILKHSLLSSINRENSQKVIHDASFSDSSMIEQTYLKVTSESPITIKEKIEDSNSKLQRLRNLREKLKINDSTSEFEKILSQIEQLQKELVLNDEKIEALSNKLNQVNEELVTINASIEKLEHAIFVDKKTDTSFKEAKKIIQLSERFRKLQLQKKMQQVEQEALRMLNKLFRKKNYIYSISIDPQTYEVDLLDAENRPLNKMTLSSGEKQMLLIALIWAVFKSSQREVPFIFDTLLGRLDKSHKRALLTDFLPHAGTQSIILSTDSEIDQEYFSILQPHLAKEYTLHFNVGDQSTNILHEYLPLLTEGTVRP
ncbi:DNA sulfur modification protein DndD [Bhargavaea massiliensis]|uniref:DNA sulfur modification protein DndD n=1 Tax=Bhargavaea massiliensis TaxID=2697500 RepID=UPI001BCAAD49|nr:DNA sulfur modification protein DndD [Bhargavaea massiliensis]